ncbi:DUF397 domain-containing protein [Streptomyces sp. NPDC002920]
MSELNWQKSSYSEEGSSCVYLAATPNGTILLQESDEPGTMLATGATQIRALISTLTDGRSCTPSVSRASS